jgi:sugar phosphate permease
VLVVIAVVGFLASLLLPRLSPGDATLKFDWNPVGSYILAIRDMAKGPLLTVALAWGFFYFLSGLGLLILPEYTIVFGIDEEEAARLLGVLGVTIGIGSLLAGLISGHAIEPRLVPIGAIGMGGAFIALGFVANSFWMVGVLIGIAGLFAGFYIIPLQAMLQHLSPDDERGRFLGTANAISFSFLSVASLLYWAIRPMFPKDEPYRIFALCGVLMFVCAGYFVFRLRRVMKGRIAASPG